MSSQKNKPGLPMTISACLIVKDEQELLPRCLASIRNLADEIILVDTGSQDRTLEIAGEFDCRIFHFPWTGNFAKARNESLRRATGEWIFIIDADEELPETETTAIRRLIENPAIDIVSLSVYNKSLASGQVSSFLPSVRLFRKRLGLTYEGIVHNRLILPADIPVMRCDLKLYHYGYDLSREKLEQKKTRSLDLLQIQLEQNPDDIFAHFNMAQLLRGLDGAADRDTCRKIIEHARHVIDSPDRGETGHSGYRLMAHIQAASAMCTLGQYDDAEKLCLEALDLKPDYIDAVIVLANIYLAAQKTDGADKRYRQYLDLIEAYRPENETADIILHYLDARQVAWFGLAIIARMQGRTDQALTYYRKVIADDKSYLDTCCRMGILYLEQAEGQRAEEMFRREIELNENSATAHLGLGRALVLQGRPDRAVPFLEKAAVIDPDNYHARLYLAEIFRETGQVQKGFLSVMTVSNSAPDDPQLQYECGNMFFAMGHMAEAMTCYEAVLARRPDNNDALNNLGNCHFRLENYEKACSVYEQLLARFPEYWPAYRNLGLTQARLGHSSQALSALAKYVEHVSEDIEIYRVIGDLFHQLSYYGQAIGCYEKYLQQFPNDMACLMNLADGYLQLGQHEAAAAGYRHILEVNPGYKPARERLDFLLQPEASG